MRTRRTATVAALLLATTVAVTACQAAPDAPEEASGSLEQIAERAGCAPDLQTDAAELRQAQCATDDGKYVLTTFATDRGQREWLNESKDYGGSYLVGRKWTVSGDAGTVEQVRERLGGRIETTEPHAPHASPSSGSSGHGSGHESGHGSGHH
ncbi:hypothetical protein M5362_07770 [Streptomyces sp. Je 1-79]|uniref:hypothetical protein n=1 Tax=Streptomyces sp. Je 1-79 TaxID=2943847 RepID=UPI0021A5BA44|nr:hypothetical protein [Streptomyces sp. Je 1-79]MCT4353024.1 hypothetical protein [Streptomyces sp. Je 1-79]